MGFSLEDLELQTPAGAAARELAGKRVLALAMTAIVPDLDGLELVGHDSDAVLVGGCDETLEPNQVFSYMNLARAFGEIQMGALALLPAQEQVVADEPRADAGQRARSWPGSSTRRASKRRCSGSPARRTSPRRSTSSTPSPS